MADQQANLNAAYPGASNGSAVVDSSTGDYWIKQSGIWKNYGQILGSTIDLSTYINPWNEKVIIDGIVGPSLDVTGFAYKLNSETIAGLSVSISLDSSRIYKINAPTSALSLAAIAPSMAAAKNIFPYTSAIALVVLSPQRVKASIVVQSPKQVDLSGNTVTIVAWSAIYPVAISVSTGLPRITVRPFVASTGIQIAAKKPDKIGAIKITPVITISVSARIPVVKASIVTTRITIVPSAPGISPKSIQLPLSGSYAINVIRNLPSVSGKRVLATNFNIGISAIAPTIEGFFEIDPLAYFNAFHVTWDHTIFDSNFTGYIPGVNVYGYFALENTSATASNGSRVTTQKKFGTYSGEFLTTYTNTCYLRVQTEKIDTNLHPWFLAGAGGEQASDFDAAGPWYFNDDTNNVRKNDFYLSFWVYPSGTSLTGTTDADNRPLITDSNRTYDGAATVLNRGYEIFFRGPSAGSGTVYCDFPLTNFSTNVTTTQRINGTANSLNANAWNHVVVAFKDNYLGIAVNGTWGSLFQIASGFGYKLANQKFDNSLYPYYDYVTINIGRFTNENVAYFTYDLNKFNGYIDDIKLVKQRGIDYYLTSPSVGVWNNFTPPTSSTPSVLANRPQATGNVWLNANNNYQSTNTYTVFASFYEREMWKWFWDIETKKDSQALETSVKNAVNKFILRLKQDNLWISLTDCYLFVGARAYLGAIDIPLKGSPPTEWHTLYSTPTGFEIADYNRKTGIKGNGTSKFIRTDRSNNYFSTSNHHRAAWVSSVGTGPIFSSGYTQAGATYVDWVPGLGGIRHGFNTNSLAINGTDAISSSGGFVGFSRPSEAYYDYVIPGDSGRRYVQAQQPYLEPCEILTASIDQANNYQRIGYGSHRLSFYSQGAALDLKQLGMRVKMLLDELNSVIV